MTVLPIVLAILTVAVVFVIAGALLATSGTRGLVRRRVVLHTKDDRTLRGVLTGTYRDCLVIGQAEYLHEARPTDLEGDAVVLRANVSWLQVLTAEG